MKLLHKFISGTLILLSFSIAMGSEDHFRNEGETNTFLDEQEDFTDKETNLPLDEEELLAPMDYPYIGLKGSWGSINWKDRYTNDIIEKQNWKEGASKLQQTDHSSLNVKNEDELEFIKTITETNYEYKTIDLFLAAIKGFAEAIKIIVTQENVDLNAKTKQHIDALISATRTIDPDACMTCMISSATEKRKLYAKYMKDSTAIMLAIENNHIEVVKVLAAQENIDLNAKNDNDYTTLMVAINCNNVEAVEFLATQENIDLNAKNKEHQTALMLAIYSNNVEAVEILAAQKNIDLNAKNLHLYKNNFFHPASHNPMIKKKFKDPKILAFLLKNGLSLYDNYSDENKDTWQKALNKLNKDDRDKILSERSWYGSIMKKLFLGGYFIPPVILNYHQNRKTQESARGRTIFGEDEPNFRGNIVHDFTLVNDHSLDQLSWYKASANRNFEDKTGSFGKIVLPEEMLNHIAKYMMFEAKAEETQHTDDIIIGKIINTRYRSTKNHHWKKSISYKKILLALFYGYLCEKLHDNIDFSALSPLGNTNVLLEGLWSPKKLLTRAKDTATGISYDIGKDLNSVYNIIQSTHNYLDQKQNPYLPDHLQSRNF